MPRDSSAGGIPSVSIALIVEEDSAVTGRQGSRTLAAGACRAGGRRLASRVVPRGVGRAGRGGWTAVRRSRVAAAVAAACLASRRSAARGRRHGRGRTGRHRPAHDRSERLVRGSRLRRMLRGRAARATGRRAARSRGACSDAGLLEALAESRRVRGALQPLAVAGPGGDSLAGQARRDRPRPDRAGAVRRRRQLRNVVRRTERALPQAHAPSAAGARGPWSDLSPVGSRRRGRIRRPPPRALGQPGRLGSPDARSRGDARRRGRRARPEALPRLGARGRGRAGRRRGDGCRGDDVDLLAGRLQGRVELRAAVDPDDAAGAGARLRVRRSPHRPR